MFYNFNSFTGRLIGAAHVHPYFPVSARSLDKNEPPKIIFETPNLKLAKTPAPPPPPGSGAEKLLYQGGIPQKLKDKMKLFQKPDGIPVYLKGGPGDKVLFGLTLAMGTVGFGYMMQFFYENSFPRS